jgi:MOSC domain-containing protein YiiM
MTAPQEPCYKLAVRFESDDTVRRFLAGGRTGSHLAVTHEGEFGAGDEIKMIARDPNAVPSQKSLGRISQKDTAMTT